MIKPIAAEPRILIKKAEKPVVQFFSKSPSPFSNVEHGENTKSIIGGIVAVSAIYLYKKYRRNKLAKGEKLNPTIDNTAIKWNKKINRYVYDTSKILRERGLNPIANMFRGLIFKI